jgi:tyrosinase
VTLSFWDETGEKTKHNGVPAIFLQEKFTLGRVSIDNPLYSYEFPETLTDNVDAVGLYTKARKYKTVRYPYSGLVGSENAIQITEKHNAKFTLAEAADNLNSNVQNWLNLEIEVTHTNPKGVDVTTTIPTGTRKKFEECLKAPKYTVFSNTTSAGAVSTSLI